MKKEIAKLAKSFNKKLNSIIEMDSLIILMLNDLTNCKYTDEAKKTIENVKQAIDNNYGND